MQVVKGEITGYLQRLPSDPEEITTVTQFCREGIALFTDAIVYSHCLANSGAEQQLRDRINTLLKSGEAYESGRNRVEKFQLSPNGGIIIEIPPEVGRIGGRNNNMFFGLIADAAFIHETLPRFEYAWELADKLNNPQRAVEKARGAHDGLNWKYLRIRQNLALSFADPEVRLFNLIFLEQLAKAKAIGSIKEQLVRLRPRDHEFYISPSEDPIKATKYVMQRVGPALYHLGYLARIIQLQHIVAESGGRVVTEEQPDLLKKIAFFRRGSLPASEMTLLLSPVLQAVSNGRWADVAADVAFLMNNFSGSFPTWRQIEHPGRSFGSIDDLVRIVLASSNPSALLGMPNDYRELVGQRIKQIEERANQKEELERLKLAKKEEEKRKRALVNRLMLESLALVSKSQAESEGRKPDFNSDLPISPENPLRLSYRGEISDMENLTPTREDVFTDVIRDEEGLVRMLFAGKLFPDFLDKSQISGPRLAVLFKNLIYQQLLKPEMVANALENLKQKNQAEGWDNCYDVLFNLVSDWIKDLNGYMKDNYYLPQTLRTSERKIIILTEFLGSFKP
ncbi:MAG: hypothetical protein HY429_02470 [Candidatus Levybacteria bacterium]|nr:hypothetical protein [Candidatus Levybacteria bacterium]